MKVIANQGADTFLVSMTRGELQNFAGYYEQGGSDATSIKIRDTKDLTGVSIHVGSIYSNIQQLASLPETVANLKEYYNRLGKTLELAEKAVERVEFKMLNK